MVEKIVHIISTMDARAGGVSQAVRTMVTGLAAYPVHNTVVSLDETEVQKEDEGFERITLGRGKSAWNYNQELAEWLRKHMQAYDLVIVHGLWQYQCLAVLRAMRQVDTRVYVMPHGMLDPYFQRAPDRKLKAIRNRMMWSLVEKKLVSLADGMLFTCETEKLLARETFSGYRPQSELVVGLGVEKGPDKTDALLAQFMGRFPAIKSEGYWLFISRIHPKKGLDLLIRAYLQLAETIADVPQLVVAGPGLDTDYGAEIKAMVKNHPDIIFTDMLSGDDKWGAFYGCSAFVLPSHQENFGIAVVEALSCSKPVLISDQVNIWREIVEGKGGLVAADNLAGALHLLKGWLALTAQQRKEMEESAFQVYETYFNVAVAATRLKEALRDGLSV